MQTHYIFRALRQAQSKVQGVRTDLANLKSNYASLSHLVTLGEQAVELRQHDVDRKSMLVSSRSGTQVDLENAKAALLTAELQLQLGRQQLATFLNQLLGNSDLSIESFPAYQQANGAGSGTARSRSHRNQGADCRYGDAGRQHSIGAFRDCRHAGVQHHR